jgi:hypothetical protein
MRCEILTVNVDMCDSLVRLARDMKADRERIALEGCREYASMRHYTTQDECMGLLKMIPSGIPDAVANGTYACIVSIYSEGEV